MRRLCAAVVGGLLGAAAPAAAQPADTLSTAELDTLNAYLKAALASPRETAYLQILAEARLALAPGDSVAVYDVVVRYDPDRFHAPYAGLYPLSFEDQFIQWGKRVSLFTRSVPIRTGRYYLHDLSTGRHAWIFTEETRLLYRRLGTSWPPPVAADASAGQRPWLQRLHGAQPGTPLQQMTVWLRLLRRESRQSVLARLAASGG